MQGQQLVEQALKSVRVRPAFISGSNRCAGLRRPTETTVCQMDVASLETTHRHTLSALNPPLPPPPTADPPATTIPSEKQRYESQVTASSASSEPVQQHTPRATASQQHQQQSPTTPSAHSKYDDAYHQASQSIASRAASMSISTPTLQHHPARQRYATDMDYNGNNHMDVDMDADPFNQQKYSRPPTNSSGLSSQYLPVHTQDDGSNRARYSPMNTSPTAFTSPPQQQQQQQQLTPNPVQYTSYTPQQAARQSPHRQSQSQYASPTQQGRYYASPPASVRAHTNQLPPLQSNLQSPTSFYPQSATQQLNAVFGHDAPEPEKKTPQQQQQQQQQSAHGNSTVPQFSRIYNAADLHCQVNAQPPFRRANPEGGFISPLQALTTHLPATYRICNPAFQYESSRNPRRVLTKPSKGVKNDGYDNEDSDYILYVNDILGSEETNHKNRYLILDVLGQGTFGQVVKCQNLKTQEVVAVKVVKNKTAYFNQSMMEVSVLDLLNGRMDKNDDHHILRLKDTFIHRQHLCLVFELLSVNLYELIKQNQFRGLSTTLVRVFAQQLLNGLCLLSKAKLIHCDLKPENILLKK